MSEDRVPVALGARSYEVAIGRGLLANSGRHIASLQNAPSSVAVVTDENVRAAHLDRLLSALDAVNIRCRTVAVIPPGEASKSITVYADVMEQLLGSGLERRDAVVALGGGVVGDLAGLVAATLRRGAPLIQIATSLLAQVDSSVGGKTGINSRSHGKNLIGAFHQPSLVLCDIDALETLPIRQLRAGYAEVAKYGLLGDADFFEWLDENRDRLTAKDPAALQRAVRRSVEMKAEIVGRDETEQGERALLNLGHTFGHALEAWAGYSDGLLHGEAVAIGMTLAFRLSEELDLAPPQSAARVAGHLRAMNLPTRISDIPGSARPVPEQLFELMRQDKKVVSGQMTLILARAIGEAFITRDVTPDRLQAFLRHALDS